MSCTSSWSDGLSTSTPASGLESGTALIVDSTPVATRARTQGTVDVLIAISGAGGASLSGMVVGASSYAVLSLAGGFLSLLLIPVVAWHRSSGRELVGSSR